MVQSCHHVNRHILGHSCSGICFDWMHLHEVLLVWIVCHMHLLHPLYGQVKHCNGRSSIVMTDQALCWQLKPCCSKCITYRQHKILFPQYYNDSLQGNKWLQCLLQEKSKVILQSCLLLEANPTGRLFAHGCFHKQRGKHMYNWPFPPSLSKYCIATQYQSLLETQLIYKL